ncbi:MAG: AAA family ATPase [Phycisphaerae bacterium]|jgi:predicted ATPase
MIQSIIIQNFKSLRNVSVDLAPLTVLIGRSGTGKSNFVQAIRFLRDFLNDGSVNKPDGWGPMTCATAPTGDKDIEIRLHFDVPQFASEEFGYGIRFRFHNPGNPYQLSMEWLQFGNQRVFEVQTGKWTRVPPISNPPPIGDQAVLGRIHGLQEVKVAHLALTKGIGCHDFPGNVLQDGRFDLSKGTALDDTGANYLAAFDAVVNELSELESVKEIIASLRKLNGSLTSVQLSQDRSSIIVGHRMATGEVLSFPLRQESEGMRRFLAHLLALYQQPPRQVLVFEEPEKGIYPGALTVLADCFRVAAEKRDTQILLTTHSPEFLRHFGPDEIRVVEMINGESRIGPLAPDQQESLRDHLLTADELLTVVEARGGAQPVTEAEAGA